MKPCSRNRKLIAWLALDALDARKATALRDHLTLCEGCRRYWEEMAKVTEGLVSARTDSNLEASEFLHQRLVEKLQAVESGSGLENLTAWVRGWIPNWRLALPAIAVLVIALFTVVALQHHPAFSPPAPRAVQVVLSASSSGNELAPTIANYQMIANQSLDEFSELLTRQGTKSLPPAPVYTVSSPELANGSF